MPYRLYHTDAIGWLRDAPAASIHAVVTDPPFGVEYEVDELKHRMGGKRGIWRLPPSYDGAHRQPVPRFTDLSQRELDRVRAFFTEYADALFDALVPGAHIFIASTPVLSHLIYSPLMDRGFEKRGEVIRTIASLRGGDRPKNAHEDYADVSVMPRGRWEPWGLFRKPIEGTVAKNLAKWGTGALRRPSTDVPFADLIMCGRTPARERAIAGHPSLKPQMFLRKLVHAALPLGEGTILDSFMGSGSTIAAATALRLDSIGIERDAAFFEMAESAVPQLAALTLDDDPPPAVSGKPPRDMFSVH